jgi:Cytochrome P450
LTEIDGKQCVKEDPDMLSTYYPFGAILMHLYCSFALMLLSLYSTEGIGIRGCMGRPLAEMELYMIIATIVRRFKLRPAPQTTEKTMQCVCSYRSFTRSAKGITPTQAKGRLHAAAQGRCLRDRIRRASLIPLCMYLFRVMIKSDKID